MADVINRATLAQASSVNTPDYPSVDWIHNPDLSAVAAVPKRYWKVVADAVVEMTQAEKDVVDATNLAGMKAARIVAVDLRTDELIAQGFAFAGKVFSLSLAAQAKMTGIHAVKDHPAITYPIVWNTKDDLDHHSLASAAEVEGFYLTALGTIRAHLDSGTALHDAVNAATTQAELDAVVDLR